MGAEVIVEPLSFIWRSAEPHPEPNTWTYFRRAFTWNNAQRRTILFAADPTARLWINGQLVLPRVMRFVSPQITVEELDCSPYLREGENFAVVLHHWWGVPTFQRSRGGKPGFAIQSEFLKTDTHWRWHNADEFLAHPHQTIGGNANRIRFPLIMDTRCEVPDLHDRATGKGWKRAAAVRSEAWSHPILKETAKLIREQCFPKNVEAVGTVFPPDLAAAPCPAAPVSWLVKHSRYRPSTRRAKNSGGSVTALLPGGDGYVTLDFGKPLHGYLQLEITNAPAGAVLDFTYGEIRDDLYTGKQVLLGDGSFDPELIVGTPFGDRLILKGGKQSVEIPEERTWRWLMVTWRNAAAPIEIQSISVMSSQHPAPGLGTFEAPSVKEIPDLVNLCLDHARVTMSDTYVDTPGREDGQWLEDIQPRAQIAAQWFGDTALRQVTLRHTVEQQAASGRFRVFPPEDYQEHGVQNLDWGIVWIGMLYDDWMWTGETTRVCRYFPNLVRFLDLAHTQTNADGLLADRTCMADIRCVLRPNFDDGEVESISNAWYFGYLKNAAALAQAIGETSRAAQWTSRAEQVRKHFRRFLARTKTGRHQVGEVWSPVDGVKGFGQGATVSATFHGILPPELAREGLESAFGSKDGSPPPGVGRWNNPTYAYRALRTLSDHGMGTTAGAHFLERYRPFLPDGPLPEYFIPGSGQPPDPTGSHGWAAVPLVWLHDTVLGVRMVSTGGTRISFEPVYVGWPQVRGETMTPRGPCAVSIDWKRKIATLTLPRGVSCRVKIGSRRITLKSAKTHVVDFDRSQKK